MTSLPPLGTRIVVRSRTGGLAASGRPELTDVIGRLVGAEQDTLLVERRDGSRVPVERSAIVALRRVPDRPVRRRRAADVDAEDLTAITSRGWPAVETERLGDWELRAAAGFTGRANSVAVTGRPGVDDDAAVQQVVDWYRARSLTPTAQVVIGSPAEEVFVARGWGRAGGARPGAVALVADLDRHLSADAEIRTELSDAWLALYGRVGEDPDAARAVLAGPATVGFVQVGDPVVAIARVVVTGEWAGLAAVEVRPERRREGLATQVTAAALGWAVEHGADKAYLQTMRDNTAALALYARFGFVEHHEYRYLQPPV